MKKEKIIVALLLFMASFTVGLIANTSRDLKMEPFLDKNLLSKKLLFFTNIERAKNNLLPLILSPGLAKAAQWQANYSLKLGSLTHSSQTETMQNTGKRIDYFGDTWKICGEISTINFSRNIANIPFYVKKDDRGEYFDFAESTVFWRNETQLAIAMVKSWMASQKHSSSILNKKFNSVGIGTAKGTYRKEPAWFAFQVFSDKKLNISKGLNLMIKKYGALALYNGDFKLGAMLVILDEKNPTIEKVNFKMIGTGIYKLSINKPKEGNVFITLEDKKGFVYPVKKLF